MKKIISSFLVAGAVAGCSPKPQIASDILIDQKRVQIINSMNTLVEKHHIPLKNGDQCMITIFGKKGALQAILSCNGEKIFVQDQPVVSQEEYVTQILNIDTLPNGLLNNSDGCFIIEQEGNQIAGGPDCHIPEELLIPAQKGKPKLII